MRRTALWSIAAAGLLLVAAGDAWAQRGGGGGGTFTGGGTGSTGTFAGGGTGTFAGGGTGTFAGGGTGTFAGGGTGTFAGGGTGTFAGGGGTGSFGGGGIGGRGGMSAQPGATSPFGRFLGNPLAAGRVAGSATQSGSIAAQSMRAYPQTLSFGATVTDTASVSRTGNLGTTGLGTGFGQTGLLGQTGMSGLGRGATSIAVRRSPAFLTEPVFDLPRPVPVESLRSDLQGIVSRSTRLPSRENISVTAREGVIVLSGKVRDQREKQLAELIVRMSPGVREVKNDLTFPPAQK